MKGKGPGLAIGVRVLEIRPMTLHNIRFSVLASGSKGNACYVQTKRARILIDAGLSCREIERRLDLVGAELPAELLRRSGEGSEEQEERQAGQARQHGPQASLLEGSNASRRRPRACMPCSCEGGDPPQAPGRAQVRHCELGEPGRRR